MFRKVSIPHPTLGQGETMKKTKATRGLWTWLLGGGWAGGGGGG